MKRCFVIMGFGTKTDLATGRPLDLDKTYRLLIKPVVEAKGMTCIRADEIYNSGTIDVPMYKELFRADLVIADLSTANVNAFYELGIRHALRPRTTIVISEMELKYPFDLNHIKITSYRHMGLDIGYDEVGRFRDVLGKTIDNVLNDEQPDSPVYTFMGSLIPPSLREQAEQAAVQINEVLSNTSDKHNQAKSNSEQGDNNNETLSVLTSKGEECIRKNDFIMAKTYFATAVALSKSDPQHLTTTNNAYLIHQLVLSTYKAKLPNPVSALYEAYAMLDPLDLNHTNDPKTVGLAGSIKKNLYENGEGDQHLSDAILFFERGYYLLNNRFNGINLAYLFNCRADSSLCKTREEQIADMVWASRTRRRILEICDKDLADLSTTKNQPSRESLTSFDLELSKNQEDSENERRFWILVNKAESHFGLGEMQAYEEARMAAFKLDHEPWMYESFEQHVQKLRKLLEKHRHLLFPSRAERMADVAGSLS